MRHDAERQETQTIRRALDQSARAVDAAVAARLARARDAALANMRHETGLRLAGQRGDMGHAMAPKLRVAFALLGLTLGIVGAYYYWNPLDQGDDKSDEIAEVDSALLSDDLPVDAYADQGFQAWLEHTSASQPSP